jgi:CheY-like chemotaxis protein
MAVALICSPMPLDTELGRTLLWRREFVRHWTANPTEAEELAHSERPTIVLVDRDLPWAERMIALLRRDSPGPDMAIVILARGAVRPLEAELMESGADAVLRLPPGPGWDADFARLVGQPLRRQERLALSLRVDAQVADDLVTATILNLSEFGMLVQSPVPLEIGRDIDFSFRLPAGQLPVTGSGRVVREASPTHFGVEFLVLEAEDRDRIRALVAASAAG